MATYNLVQAVFDRDNLSAGEDVAVITMHIRAVVQAAPDIIPVGDQARDNWDGKMRTYANALAGYMTDKIMWRELRYYDVPATRGLPMGDPVRVTPLNVRGTATTNPMPPQCAVSVTFKTQHRLQWGRFYLPGITSSHLDPTGRLDSISHNAIAAATTALTSRAGTGAALVVFSRKKWTHEDPELVQVDDIIDIVRRRRFSFVKTKTVFAAG